MKYHINKSINRYLKKHNITIKLFQSCLKLLGANYCWILTSYNPISKGDLKTIKHYTMYGHRGGFIKPQNKIVCYQLTNAYSGFLQGSKYVIWLIDDNISIKKLFKLMDMKIFL